MVVYGTAKVTHAGGAGLVGSEAGEGFFVGFGDEGLGWGRRGDGERRWRGDAGGVIRMVMALGGVVTEG